jgi:hypothetical protein
MKAKLFKIIRIGLLDLGVDLLQLNFLRFLIISEFQVCKNLFDIKLKSPNILNNN